jgi:hypothetical protein
MATVSGKASGSRCKRAPMAGKHVEGDVFERTLGGNLPGGMHMMVKSFAVRLTIQGWRRIVQRTRYEVPSIVGLHCRKISIKKCASMVWSVFRT